MANKKSTEQTLELLIKHKILLWIMIFPPVAIYRIIKYKIFNTITIISFVLTFTLVFGYSVYSTIQPMIAFNDQLTEEIEKLGFGTIREVEHIGIYDGYMNSNIITTTGYYTIYYKNEQNVNIETVIELHSEINPDIVLGDFKIQYKSETIPEIFIETHPAILQFTMGNQDFGALEDVLETNENSQTIKTSKGIYKFRYDCGQLLNIQEKQDEEFIDVMNRDYVLEMSFEFQKALSKPNAKKQYYEIANVLDYQITETSIGYVFSNFCGNIYKITKLDNGQIILEAATETNMYSQEDLPKLWLEYQNAK